MSDDLTFRELTLGETIRSVRKARGAPLRTVAVAAHISAAYLCDIEYDRRVPSDHVLAAIATVLEVDGEELLALTARLGEEFRRYIRRTPEAALLFRRIAAANLQGSALIEMLAKFDEVSARIGWTRP